MTANTEIFQMLPHVVLGIGIIVSIVIEISSKKSEAILPWFSILLFMFAAAYSIVNVQDNQVLFGGMFVFNFMRWVGIN